MTVKCPLDRLLDCSCARRTLLKALKAYEGGTFVDMLTAARASLESAADSDTMISIDIHFLQHHATPLAQQKVKDMIIGELPAVTSTSMAKSPWRSAQARLQISAMVR